MNKERYLRYSRHRLTPELQAKWDARLAEQEKSLIDISIENQDRVGNLFTWLAGSLLMIAILYFLSANNA